MTRGGYWVAWGVVAFTVSTYLGLSLARGEKAVFLPGATTAGHYQIELSCDTCHTPFQGVSNEPCLKCHAEELAAADDSHPKSKFTDPRNAEFASKLDAISCISCHREHHPGIARAMGVTLPDDYCRLCHEKVGADRPTHKTFAFNTCATAGCHNYHDNTALYEDFLVAHANDPDVASVPVVAQRRLADVFRALGHASTPAVSRDNHDAPPTMRVDAALLTDWATTSHARAGVNCTGCHQPPGGTGQEASWVDRPGLKVCAGCHDNTLRGFLGGKHGMRLAADLGPMTPEAARQPMKSDSHTRELSCTSCHSAHRFDTSRAAVDACVGCHDDRHTLAYKESPHYKLWVRERDRQAPEGSGVSCATCHLPRERRSEQGKELVFVQHNQNLNLRPNEKMVRTVCLNCHGLRFSLDALADTVLVARNFKGRPARHIESIDMAVGRIKSSIER